MSICSPAQKEGQCRRLHLAKKRSVRSELSKIGNDIRAPDYALAAPCEGGSKASSGRDWRLDVELHETAQTTPTLPQGRSKEKSTNHPSRNRQKTITQAGTKGSQGLSPSGHLPQQPNFAPFSPQFHFLIITLFCSASFPMHFSFSPSTLTLVCSKDSLVVAPVVCSQA